VWAHKEGVWSRIVDVSDLVDETATRCADGAAAAPALLARDALRALTRARVEKVRLPASEGGAEALCLLPEAGAAGAAGAAGSVPWVLKLHGGPHAASLDAFNVEAALFLLSGVGVLLPNYRGSIGFGSDFSEALLGDVPPHLPQPHF
jgi:dipeptidyl aminopeptidase/acylaminoacyl peptidase